MWNNSQGVLVTGSEGRLGRLVRRKLTERGCELVERFDKVLGDDIRDPERVRRSALRCDSTIHLAGIAHPGACSNRAYVENNVVGSLVVLEQAIRAGHKRFIGISSGAVYGWDCGKDPNHGERIDEKAAVAFPSSEPYTMSKLLSEGIYRLLAGHGEIDVIILRLAPIWNPGEEASERHFRAAVSPTRATLAVVRALDIEVPCGVTTYNIADPVRAGRMVVEDAISAGLLDS